MSMVLNFVDQARHRHVLPKVLLHVLAAGLLPWLAQPGLVEEPGEPGHVAQQGAEGHHAEGRGRHGVGGLVREVVGAGP